MENYILEIKNLEKTYQTKEKEIKAVEKFDLKVKKGDFIAIVGPSGCGKSTILSILSGIDNDYKGDIKLDKEIGYMLQQDALFDWRTVYENAILGLEIKNIKTKDNEEYVKNLLNTYGLKEFIKSYPHNLSGGMRQRVALIRTLATKPDIILLDEPFSALDYQSKLKVSEDVYNILKKEGKTAIIVTHNIAEAIMMTNKVIILSKRPAKIKKMIDITWDKEMNFKEKRSQIIFNKYYDEIWKEIDDNV